MNQRIETVIVGGGQAGLATSHYLTALGREHVILERAPHTGSAWRDDRWDSFTLLTPNWSLRLPGAEYRGQDPDGFLTRQEVIAHLEQYVKEYHLPVHHRATVRSVEPAGNGTGYVVRTDGGTWLARHVVIATGFFQHPRVPALSADLPAGIIQVPSGQYRNPDALPPGAVLVVGSAQSGCQIAEELYESGRKVYLCVGRAGRVPRRYRGRDTFEWLELVGFLDRTVDTLPTPRAKFGGSLQVSGRDGGRTLNLHQFARDGVTLLGHLEGARDGVIRLASDLRENLAQADETEAQITRLIDGYIAQNGLDAPPDELVPLRDAYAAPEIASLDLKAAGVSAIIWAMGYTFDYSLVRLPVVDADGYPVQTRGVTAYPGLYFVGMPWLHKFKSGLLIGVGEDAEYIASRIATVDAPQGGV